MRIFIQTHADIISFRHFFMSIILYIFFIFFRGVQKLAVQVDVSNPSPGLINDVPVSESHISYSTSKAFTKHIESSIYEKKKRSLNDSLRILN